MNTDQVPNVDPLFAEASTSWYTRQIRYACFVCQVISVYEVTT